MAEWSNAHDSKSCYVGTRTGVRIPLSAPYPAERQKSLGGIFFAKRMRDSRGGKATCCRRSEVSTDDKTADTRCFPCASAQGANPSLCATQRTPFGVSFCVAQRENLRNAAIRAEFCHRLPLARKGRISMHKNKDRQQKSCLPYFNYIIYYEKDFGMPLFLTKSRYSSSLIPCGILQSISFINRFFSL